MDDATRWAKMDEINVLLLDLAIYFKVMAIALVLPHRSMMDGLAMMTYTLIQMRPLRSILLGQPATYGRIL